MFRPDICNPGRFADLQQAGTLARAELQRLNRIVHGTRATPAMEMILWAHVHGLAELMIDGPLALQLISEPVRHQALREIGEQFADLMLPGG